MVSLHVSRWSETNFVHIFCLVRDRVEHLWNLGNVPHHFASFSKCKWLHEDFVSVSLAASGWWKVDLMSWEMGKRYPWWYRFWILSQVATMLAVRWLLPLHYCTATQFDCLCRFNCRNKRLKKRTRNRLETILHYILLLLIARWK